MKNNEEVLIKVKGISKKFSRDLKSSLLYGVQDIGYDLLCLDGKSEILRDKEFFAVNDVSFELKRGESLGLIGRNGAGKTTILKLLNGLIKPDKGKITMKGRVGALIALGAGFNPILTGRENIFIYGSVLGLAKKEIVEKLDEIIEFAELEEFIDTPVQNYSSGMQVRLGFAVASSLEPDILLIDEVLAVGDVAFRVKCYNRIRNILPNTAVVIVSHNMFDIARISNKVLVLSKGTAKYFGARDIGIEKYNKLNITNSLSNDNLVVHTSNEIHTVELIDLKYTDGSITTDMSLSFSFHSKSKLGYARVRVVFYNMSEQAVAEWDSTNYESIFDIKKNKNVYDIIINNLRLMSGSYRLSIVVSDMNNYGYHFNIERGVNMLINNKAIAGAPYKV